MGKPDLEDVIDALSSALQEQFPSALQAVDARKQTPLNPQLPRQYIFGDYQQMPQLPAMLVTGHQTVYRKDEIGWRDQQYDIIIEAYYAHSDLQKLSRIVRRYGAAIDDTLRDNNTLGGLVKNITNIQQRYWETMKGQPGLYQVVIVECEVHLITD